MDEQKKEKKKLSRNQSAIHIILATAGMSGVLGAFFAALLSFSDWNKFPEDWLSISATMLFLFGGFIVGGMLTLIFQKWDEDFCGKAGLILWYGTIGGGFALSQLLKFELGRGVFIAAFVISALVCSILKEWGEHGEGKDAAKTSLIIILSLVAITYVFSIRAHNEAKAENVEKEKASYESAYQEGYDRGQEVQKEADIEKYCYEGRSIYDIEESILDYYGMTPYEAGETVLTYLEEPDHEGITWEEYQKAIEVSAVTAGLFPYND